MDLSIPIVGLMAFIGYKLNDKKQPRNKNELRTKISPHEKPSGRNIYHSTFSKEIDTKERKLADIQFEKSKNPENTNIIPPLYNTFCKWDCDDTVAPALVDENSTILPRVKPVEKNTVQKRENQIMSGPMFRNVEIQGINLEENENINLTSGGSNPIFKENFSEIDKVNTLTGLPMEMKHNNMVPFFGSNITQNTQLNKNSSILENYTGTQDTPTRKREVPKMFSNKRENVFGSRPVSNLIGQDRFIQTNLKTNLLPVPQIKVQPLPEEYVRPAFKNIDNLRVKNNPKVTYKTPVIAGQHFVSNRGVQPKVVKNQPDTFYINGPERYFTSVGDIKAPKVRENFNNLKFTPKAETSEIAPNINPAYDPTRSEGKSRLIKRSNAPFSNSELFTIADDDTRQTYKKDWVRNAKHEIVSHNYLDRDGYVAYEQERQSTNRMTILPASDTSRGYHQSNPNDARTTHKESNLFSYTGNAAFEVDKPQDYNGAYNYTREKQWINNPDYKGAPSQTSKSFYDQTQYENINIFSDREEVMNKKGYTAGAQKENTPLGSCGVNMYQRDDSLRKAKYDYGANLQRIVQEPTSLFNIGCPTDEGNKQGTEVDFTERIDPELLNAHRENPYTQNLHSY